MTAPPPTPPALNEPLMTLEELAVWLQVPEISADQEAFAWKVIEGASVVVREAGSPWWSIADTLQLGWVRIPYRAKLMLDLKAKNFFEHPTGAVSETVGPLSERYLDDVVQQLVLTDAEKTLLASLVEDGGPAADQPIVQGIWALSTFRGPFETHNRSSKGVITVPWWREYWPFDAPGGSLPYFAEGELGSPITRPGELLP